MILVCSMQRISCSGKCPCAPFELPCAVVRDGCIWLVGGCPASDHLTLSTLSLHTKHWKHLQQRNAPPPSVGHTIVECKGWLYFYGGNTDCVGPEKAFMQGAVDCNSDDVYCADISEGGPEVMWNRVTTYGKGGVQPPMGRSLHSAVVWEDCMYVFGGWRKDGTFTNEVLVYDFHSGAWECATPHCGASRTEDLDYDPEPSPRCCHSAVLDRVNNRMVIFGGLNNMLPQVQLCNDAWAFSFAARQWERLDPCGAIPCGRMAHGALVHEGVMYVYGGKSTPPGVNRRQRVVVNASRQLRIGREGAQETKRVDAPRPSSPMINPHKCQNTPASPQNADIIEEELHSITPVHGTSHPSNVQATLGKPNQSVQCSEMMSQQPVASTLVGAVDNFSDTRQSPRPTSRSPSSSQVLLDRADVYALELDTLRWWCLEPSMGILPVTGAVMGTFSNALVVCGGDAGSHRRDCRAFLYPTVGDTLKSVRAAIPHSVKEGWLKRKAAGVFSSNWTPVYVILNHQRMLVYPSLCGTQPLLTVTLDESISFTQPRDPKGVPSFMMTCRRGGRVSVAHFAASSEADVQSWWQALTSSQVRRSFEVPEWDSTSGDSLFREKYEEYKVSQDAAQAQLKAALSDQHEDLKQRNACLRHFLEGECRGHQILPLFVYTPQIQDEKFLKCDAPPAPDMACCLDMDVVTRGEWANAVLCKEMMVGLHLALNISESQERITVRSEQLKAILNRLMQINAQYEETLWRLKVRHPNQSCPQVSPRNSLRPKRELVVFADGVHTSPVYGCGTWVSFVCLSCV